MSGSPAHHNLYAYDQDAPLVDHVAPFLSEGLRKHEATVLVVDPRKRALLREALGAGLDRITCIDRDTFYTRPEAALASYDAQVQRHLRDGASRVRVFGELPICRTQRDSDTWILYEALLNPAFAHHPVTIVCGLDVREQPISVIEGSWQTHPRLLLNERWSDNDHYHAPLDTVRARTPAPEEAPRLTTLRTDRHAGDLRARLRAAMVVAEVPERDAVNMLTAVGEVLTNAHRHGGGVRVVRIGHAGGRFVCEISDHGPGLDDPLAGYLPPRPGHAGVGLWIARQMTRRLEMTSSARGLTTRLWT